MDVMEEKEAREGFCFPLKENIFSEGRYCICLASDLVEYDNFVISPGYGKCKRVRFCQSL